jgi:1-acyl-sn-glycerol-3-phosphate acyltransferase
MKGAKLILMLIVSIFLWLFVAITAFLLFLVDLVVWLLTFWWDRRLKLLQKYSSVWAMFYIWINPGWRINALGLEKIDKSKSYVIVSNHQSAFDIVLLYRLYTHFKWVAKKELAKVPVIGWNLILNNSILIDRASTVSTKKMIAQGLKHLKGGSSVLIFPEGTRTKDGQVKRFKEGAFLLAKQANAPILPVVIEGSKDIFPKPGIIKLRQNITLKVLDPIDAEEVQSTSVTDMTKRLNQLIMEEHKTLAPEKYMNSDNKQVK